MGKYLMLFGVAGLLICFQNCSNGASFAAQGELVAKGDTLVAGDGSTTPNAGDGAPTAGGGTNGSGTTPCCGTTPPTAGGGTTPPTTGGGTTTPPTTGYYPPGSGHNPPSTTPGHSGGGDDSTCDNSGHGHDSDSHSEGDSKSPSSDLQYVCVLRGNGSSQRIGLSGNGLSGQVGTPNDVCMTENACLKIVSKKFDVKGAEKRGFCPSKNPHVIPMTDSEVEASLALSTLKAQFASK